MSSFFVLVTSAALFALVLFAWAGLRDLRNRLKGRRGHELTVIVYRLVTVTVVAQALTLVNAALIAFDREGTVDTRVAIFIVIEAIQSAAVLWVFHRIRRLEAQA